MKYMLGAGGDDSLTQVAAKDKHMTFSRYEDSPIPARSFAFTQPNEAKRKNTNCSSRETVAEY